MLQADLKILPRWEQETLETVIPLPPSGWYYLSGETSHEGGVPF